MRQDIYEIREGHKRKIKKQRVRTPQKMSHLNRIDLYTKGIHEGIYEGPISPGFIFNHVLNLSPLLRCRYWRQPTKPQSDILGLRSCESLRLSFNWYEKG